MFTAIQVAHKVALGILAKCVMQQTGVLSKSVQQTCCLQSGLLVVCSDHIPWNSFSRDLFVCREESCSHEWGAVFKTSREAAVDSKSSPIDPLPHESSSPMTSSLPEWVAKSALTPTPASLPLAELSASPSAGSMPSVDGAGSDAAAVLQAEEDLSKASPAPAPAAAASDNAPVVR